MPGVGLAQHHRLGALVVAARTALDQVGRQRERRTGEADQRNIAQLGHQQPHRIGDGRNMLALEGLHRGDIGGGADRVLDHRPDVGHDIQFDARGAQRHDDVGEQDGGVDAVPAHRLQGDLTDQLRIEAGGQHAVLCAQRPVLGQRTTGLPHEPHRNPARLTAAAAAKYGDSGSSRRVFIGTNAAMRPGPGAVWRPPATDTARLRTGLARWSSVKAVTTAEPAQFREAVAAMNATTVRPEIELGPIRPPQRLAPFSYALGAEVRHPETAIVPERSEGDAFGRLILLHDPDGAEAWDGTMRLVAYIQADLDSSEAVDPLLPEVAWSWLVDALEANAENVTALGGTVTATTSVRYGDISGPPRAHQLELRASWTATTLELGPHVRAFCEVLEHAAGLPPDRGDRPGVAHPRLR